MQIMVTTRPDEDQPQRAACDQNELTVAISSLSIGGAERIVLDWATRIYPAWRVHLIVLRNRAKEWPVPSFIRITRIEEAHEETVRGKNFYTQLLSRLKNIGEEIGRQHNPTCVCHLLNRKERDALAAGGAKIVTVLHNAKEGWPEGVSTLSDSEHVVAVSEACASELRESGWQGPVSVIRHIPAHRRFEKQAREKFRSSWHVPHNAVVIGMIGALKQQKNYSYALRIFKQFLEVRDAYLVILGGPIGVHARSDWQRLVDEIYALGLRHRVALPGFIPDAAQCLPAFDVLLNTSSFEGLSMATLEALVNGVPVVASKVGGQGELHCEGLTLIEKNATHEHWAQKLIQGLTVKCGKPSWENFPSFRLWTLAGLARAKPRSEKVLFVTANLNSGGAQRSLVNLAKELGRKKFFEIAVTGLSTASYFYTELERYGIPLWRSGDRDSFTHAEVLVEKIGAEGFGTVCFWNVDAKVKLLVVKALGFTNIRFIDVSPGTYSFEEMARLSRFGELIAFTEKDFYQRLDRLVLKYHGKHQVVPADKVTVIPNGVPQSSQVKKTYALHGAPRVVVNGRIAPTKYLLEIIEAMRLVRKHLPLAQLHIFGTAEPNQQIYAEEVLAVARAKLGRDVFFHGETFQIASRLHAFDASVVLGKHQGCPNALLEALAAGLPSIGNDDGGTRELILESETGILTPDTSPEVLACAILRVLSDRKFAEKIGRKGRHYVETNFSIKGMAQAYETILSPVKSKPSVQPVASKEPVLGLHHQVA